MFLAECPLKMISFSLLLRLTTAANFFAQIPLVNPFSLYQYDTRATTSLDDFIATEGPIALQGVLNNIGSAGSKAGGAASGITVASPSKTNPDCRFLPPDSSMQLSDGYWNLHLYSFIIAIETFPIENDG